MEVTRSQSSTPNFATNSGDKKINVKTRLGFLRLALRHGVDVLPCFRFGETNIHDLLVLPGAATFKKMFRVGLIIPIGRFYREEIHLVVLAEVPWFHQLKQYMYNQTIVNRHAWLDGLSASHESSSFT